MCKILRWNKTASLREIEVKQRPLNLPKQGPRVRNYHIPENSVREAQNRLPDKHFFSLINIQLIENCAKAVHHSSAWFIRPLHFMLKTCVCPTVPRCPHWIMRALAFILNHDTDRREVGRQKVIRAPSAKDENDLGSRTQSIL